MNSAKPMPPNTSFALLPATLLFFEADIQAKKAARAMAPEPPPTQPYYERRVVLTFAPPCSDGAGEETCTTFLAALSMPLHTREL
jgi:hypothetical protein